MVVYDSTIPNVLVIAGEECRLMEDVRGRLASEEPWTSGDDGTSLMGMKLVPVKLPYRPALTLAEQ